jgi:flagellar motor component MotA
MEQTKFLVEGYCFESQKEAEKAAKELEQVKAINEKLDEDNLQMVKALYLKALNQQVFETQIGFSYLRNLQMHLIEEGAMKPEENPLPVAYSKMVMQEEGARIQEEYQELLQEEQSKMEKELKKEKELTQKAGDKCKNFMILSGVLAVMVIGMFLITLTGKNENILNYKRVITNQYAEWEQDLTQREAVVRQKEIELGIDN